MSCHVSCHHPSCHTDTSCSPLRVGLTIGSVCYCRLIYTQLCSVDHMHTNIIGQQPAQALHCQPQNHRDFCPGAGR